MNITLMDGASGTLLWTMAEERGIPKVPVWQYNITHPELVGELHARYINAGTRLLFTNTFVVNRPTLEKEPDFAVDRVVRAAVRIAREQADASKEPVRVFLDMGPLPEMLEPYGSLSEEECREIYREIAEAGTDEGVDGIMLETFFDLGMMTAALQAVKPFGVPVFCSMTYNANGRTAMGDPVEEVVKALTDLGADAVGMNCGVGPAEAVPVIRAYKECTDLPLILKPNAGLPIETPSGLKVPCTAKSFSETLRPVLPLVTYLGSCCGSDETYIEALAAMVSEEADSGCAAFPEADNTCAPFPEASRGEKEDLA